MTQQQMADLFGTGRQAITKHLQNIYDNAELDKKATCSILELVRQEGRTNCGNPVAPIRLPRFTFSWSHYLILMRILISSQFVMTSRAKRPKSDS